MELATIAVCFIKDKTKTVYRINTQDFDPDLHEKAQGAVVVPPAPVTQSAPVVTPTEPPALVRTKPSKAASTDRPTL